MLRVTTSLQAPERAILQLEGWFAAEDVELIEGEAERLFLDVSHLVLDLHGVRFIDQQGIDLIKSWPPDRLVLRGASAFVCALLKTQGLSPLESDNCGRERRGNDHAQRQ